MTQRPGHDSAEPAAAAPDRSGAAGPAAGSTAGPAEAPDPLPSYDRLDEVAAGPPAYLPGPIEPEETWQRLDPRMLLVHPVHELTRFLPVLVGVFVLGGNGDPAWWQALVVAVPVVLGVLRFLTTRYRITATQIELRRGLVRRRVLTAPLDRVRAVELTSTPVHRILGLAKVEVGTASTAKQDDDRFALDALPLGEARQMRVALLHRSEDATGSASASAPAPGTSGAVPTAPDAHDELLLAFDPGWVRYAPLTSSGNVIAAGLLALFGQFSETLGPRWMSDEQITGTVERLSIGLVVVLVIVAFLVIGALFSVLGYYVANWGFRLSRDTAGRSFHVRRGLLTSTETSLERERVRGLSVDEPLGLRLAHAGRLAAIVTGVAGSDSGRTQLVPPAPRRIVDATGARVLEHDEPLRMALLRHGPAARRRRWTRALTGAAVLPVAALVLVLTTAVPGWVLVPALLALPAGAFLAFDRYRRLGHGLTEEFLVVRSGSLRGRRDMVQRSGIIGWNLHQSWFQRRAGLVTLVATTAAGEQAYVAHDVPEATAVALAARAVPGLVTPFLA